jgi:hypothetical protein
VSNLKQPGGCYVKSVARHHCTPTGMVARVHVYVCQYIIYTRTRLSLFSLEHTCTSTCIHFSLLDSVCRFSLVHKQGHGRQTKQHQFRARTQTAQITLRPLLWTLSFSMTCLPVQLCQPIEHHSENHQSLPHGSTETGKKNIYVSLAGACQHETSHSTSV